MIRTTGRRQATPVQGATPAEERGVRISIRRDGLLRPATWRELGDLDWTDFGLVLGAGGVTGMAFEAGVLLGLGVDHGVDLRQATDLVGTSAGSIVGALVALGLDSGDLAALVAGAPSHFSERALDIGASFTPGAIPTVPHIAHLIRVQSPRDVVTMTRLAMHRQYRAMLLRFLRDGQFDMRGEMGFLAGRAWPTDVRLQVCVTDSRNGSRRVIGHDHDVDLLDAVLASCAVPAVMRSVRIGDELYVDGGLVSPTSADLLGGEAGRDLVAVVSPMSGNTATTLPGLVGSRYAAGRLRRELSAYRRDQTVVVIEPIGELAKLVNDDNLGGGSATEVLQSAFTLASA